MTTFNDHCAVGVIDRLVRAGVAVPEAVSVAGYDNAPIAQFAAINLTTVSQEAAIQAQWAVRAAIERLEGVRHDTRESILEPRLIVRAAPARQDQQIEDAEQRSSCSMLTSMSGSPRIRRSGCRARRTPVMRVFRASPPPSPVVLPRSPLRRALEGIPSSNPRAQSRTTPDCTTPFSRGSRARSGPSRSPSR